MTNCEVWTVYWPPNHPINCSIWFLLLFTFLIASVGAMNWYRFHCDHYLWKCETLLVKRSHFRPIRLYLRKIHTGSFVFLLFYFERSFCQPCMVFTLSALHIRTRITYEYLPTNVICYNCFQLSWQHLWVYFNNNIGI